MDMKYLAVYTAQKMNFPLRISPVNVTNHCKLVPTKSFDLLCMQFSDVNWEQANPKGVIKKSFALHSF